MNNNKAVVLLSGGLDSATTLYAAKHKGCRVFVLIFDYHQRHRKEIECAKKIALQARCPYQIIKINFPWKGSSLLDTRKVLPQGREGQFLKKRIPSTYVPARNIIFLSYALSYAETIGAKKIFIGANAIDYSGYPDCRPEFLSAFQKVIDTGTKSCVEGRHISIEAPLIQKTKSQIIKLGLQLKVPYDLTWSCYAGLRNPCGVCDSCLLRKKGFDQLKKDDPAL